MNYGIGLQWEGYVQIDQMLGGRTALSHAVVANTFFTWMESPLALHIHHQRKQGLLWSTSVVLI